MPQLCQKRTSAEGSRISPSSDKGPLSPRSCSPKSSSEVGRPGRKRGSRDLFRVTEPFPEDVFRVPIPNRVFTLLGDKSALPGTALKALLGCILLSFRFDEGDWTCPDRTWTTSEIASASGLSGQGARDGLSALSDCGLVETVSGAGKLEHKLLLSPPSRRYTYLPISLLQALSDWDLTDTCLRVLLIVFHRTWGHTRSSGKDAPEHRRWARLPVSNLARQAGCTERSVKSAISTLSGRYLSRRCPNGAYHYRPLTAPFRDPEHLRKSGPAAKNRADRFPNGVSIEDYKRAFFSMPLPNEFHRRSQNFSPPNVGERVWLRKTPHSQSCKRGLNGETHQAPRPSVVSSSRTTDDGKTSAEPSPEESSAPMPESLRQFAAGQLSASELKARSTGDHSSTDHDCGHPTEDREPGRRKSNSPPMSHRRAPSSHPPTDRSRNGRPGGSAPAGDSPSRSHRSSRGRPASAEDLSDEQEKMAQRLVNCGVWPDRAKRLVRRFSRERIEQNFQYFRARAAAIPMPNPGAYLAQAISEGYRLPSSDADGSGETASDSVLNERSTTSASGGACPHLSPGDVVDETRKDALTASGKASSADFTQCDSKRPGKTYIYRLENAQ